MSVEKTLEEPTNTAMKLQRKTTRIIEINTQNQAKLQERKQKILQMESLKPIL